MTALYVVLGLAALAVFWLILTYNGLVRARNMALEAGSGIDVQLKRRADLVPNLVETVKGYAGHEKGLFEQVTALRARTLSPMDQAEKARVAGELTRAIGGLFAVAEGYPELKASANFTELQQQLAEVEEQIQLARRYYNASVRDLNTRIQSFPTNVVAAPFGFTAAEYFETDDPADKATPKVAF